MDGAGSENLEIERKFLVDTSLWEPVGEGTLYVQGYVCADTEKAVRVRVAGERAFLCIKGLVANFTRREFEYEIPLGDAARLLELFCEAPPIEKRRHRESHHGKVWEIDVFLGDNDGLVVAEVELGSENEAVTLPEFAGAEVSTDPRYYSFNLQRNPFGRWASDGAGEPNPPKGGRADPH